MKKSRFNEEQMVRIVRESVITIIVYAMILPIILLVPTRLTATKDGEAMDA